MSHSSIQVIALWRQLQAVAQVLAAVRRGASGTAAIGQVGADLRPGVQALVFQVWRNLGRAQALRGLLAQRAPAAPVDALLCTALALTWNRDQAVYDAHTLVNQTVEAAKRNASTARQAAFVNACLRRFLREHDALVAATDADPVAVWNHPLWWITRLQADHPQHWESILRSANAQAPMTLRVNARKTTVQAYHAQLAASGIASEVLSGGGIRLLRPVPVGRLPGFAEGWVSVQDAAAQMAAPLLLQGFPATRVLDACAAPGGKTGHLLEICEADVTALEIDPARVGRIAENLQRLGQHAEVRVADAVRPQDWWDGQPYDAILLDAPCSAAGIVRRHPDVRWLRRESDIDQLALSQQRLLRTLWPMVRPGGRLLYCTCSVFKAEGQAQVQAFLAHNTEAILLPSPGHLLPDSVAKVQGLPDNGPCDYDGFFYALLEKPQV